MLRDSRGPRACSATLVRIGDCVSVVVEKSCAKPLGVWSCPASWKSGEQGNCMLGSL